MWNPFYVGDPMGKSPWSHKRPEPKNKEKKDGSSSAGQRKQADQSPRKDGPASADTKGGKEKAKLKTPGEWWKAWKADFDTLDAQGKAKTEIGILFIFLYIISLYFLMIYKATEYEARGSDEYFWVLFRKHLVYRFWKLFPVPLDTIWIVAIMTMIFALILFFTIVDAKNRHHVENKTALASGMWLKGEDLEEFQQRFSNPELRKNIIYSEEIRTSIDAKKINRNLNSTVIGGSGSGKSFRIVIPNILQANTSYIITDPSGDLYMKYGSYLQYMGYKVKCFNLDEMDKSNHYNPFNYIHSNKDIEILVTMLIQNTNSPTAPKGDQFWEKCETALFCALIAYLYHHGQENEKNFSNVIRLIRSSQVDENDTTTPSPVDELFEAVRKQNPADFAVTQYDIFKLGAGKTLKSILISAAVRLQAFELDEVRQLTDTDDIDLDTVPDEKTALFVLVPTGEKTFNFLAAIMYSQLFNNMYSYSQRTAKYSQLVMDSDGEVVRTFRAGNMKEAVAARQQAEAWFAKLKHASIQEYDDLSRSSIDGKKTLKFYSIESRDKDGGITMLAFRGSRRLAEEALEKMRHGRVVGNDQGSNAGVQCPVHVQFLLDEFANTGRIPDFTEKVSTMRKYEISVMIILQSIKQIQNLYEKEWDAIVANCDTFAYLGGGIDRETTKWLNEAIGKETRDVQGMSFSAKGNGSTSINRQAVDMVAPNEMYTMSDQDCIVIEKGCHPYKGPKFFAPTQHPAWNVAQNLPQYSFDGEKSSRIEEMMEGVAVAADRPQQAAPMKPEKTREEAEQEQAARRNEAIRRKASELLKNNCNPAPDMTMMVHIGEDSTIDREVFGCKNSDDMAGVMEGLMMDFSDGEQAFDFSGAPQD